MPRSKKNKSNSSFGSRTDIGSIREQNEDSLAVVPPLYLICDGMGGHAAGEVASEIAVNVISQRAPSEPDAQALGQAVEEANLAIIQAAKEGTGREGMGSTCTAAILEDERLVIAQVGDSRAYLLHQDTLQQITHDHSLVADLVEAGQLTLEEARVHPERSIITRALGSDPHMQPDLYEINVEAGDRLLLCSDGLTTMLDDDRIKDILFKTEDPQLAAAQLVNAAIAEGGHDNITVIVVNIAGLAEKRRKKVARRTKITAVIIIVALVAIFGGAAYAFNYWITNSAYLGEQDGKIVIYQGVPGEVLGMNFSNLAETTDVNIDDLQPGVANRIKNKEIRADSLQAAEELVNSYRAEINSGAHENQSDDSSSADNADGSSESNDNNDNNDSNPADNANNADAAANPDEVSA